MKKFVLILSAIAAATGISALAATESRFVTPLDKEPAPKGLDGSNIAIWQSHGWYFEPKLNRWEFQRARVMQTVEDLYTQSYVMPFLMPMLENAGAYVFSPRERDVNIDEYIIDNDAEGSGYAERNGSKKWTSTKQPGFGYDGELLTVGVNPFRNGTVRMAETVKDGEDASVASWNATIDQDGDYAVYVSYQTLPNSATDAVYTVNAANGPHKFKVNQKMVGGTWIYLGHFPLHAGKQHKPIVELTNQSADRGAAITADAVKIGGGIGNVARIVKEGDADIEYEYVSSQRPRFVEGARYFMQWAGAPDSVYTPTDNVNDYTDDYKGRPLWVNWLAGGSSRVPKQEGLGIPIDLSLAFHTDAGTTMNDSIIGTLGIYCTESKTGKYPTGEDRRVAAEYTDMVMTEIVNDIRANYEPNWTRRELRNSSYAEARIPEVPAMLLELLSHQNFADMKYGLDPTFRFTVSRAVYKAMLKYIAKRDGREYVVQPLPVRAFAITGSNGQYKLTWAATADQAEPTAAPTYYIVEERVGGERGFRPIAMVDATECEIVVNDEKVRSYRVIAGNDGGVSFPSEVLALCNKHSRQQVLVVNGFTRISAPDWFDSGEIAGFYDERDHGVPYIQDISYIGSQFEFRREIPWMDDDACGFGSSRSNYETEVIAGNTFDFVAVHGQAIADNGISFISTSVEAFVDPSYPTDATVVDLILGKQKEIKVGTGAFGTKYKTFPAPLQEKLRAYAQKGGGILVSGSFIATDLWDNPNQDPAVAEADRKFAQEVLGYHWRTGQASLTGEAYEVPSRFRTFDGCDIEFSCDLNPELYVVESPDSFYPADKNGATIMRYTENNLVAGTAYAPESHRAVAIGFPFETIEDADVRAKLMGQIIKFLDKTYFLRR